MALFFAPTGKARQLVQDIEIENKPGTKSNVWLLGTYGRDETTYLGILKGTYDPSLPYKRSPNLSSLLPIDKMIPFAGSSGGPVINNEGKLIGVESGYLYNDPRPTDRKDYKGATIAPIAYLAELIQKPVHYLKEN